MLGSYNTYIVPTIQNTDFILVLADFINMGYKMVVFGLVDNNLLFQSILGRCE